MLIGKRGISLVPAFTAIPKIAATRCLGTQRDLSFTSNTHLKEKSSIREDDLMRDFEDIPLDRIKVSKNQPSPKKPEKSPINRDGVITNFSTWKFAALVALFGGAGYYYARREKDMLEIEKEEASNRPIVGGPFELVDHNGNKFTDKNLLGKFSLIYFGFTHCPDVCPAELDKLDVWLKEVEKRAGIKLQPIFVTCDPARDTPGVIKTYLEDFNPNIIGLTGTYDQIRDLCQKYRVFFSTPRDAATNEDYLVDHSTFFYLMDPEGKFIDALGDIYDGEEGVNKLLKHIRAFIPEEERKKRMKKWYSFLYK